MPDTRKISPCPICRSTGGHQVASYEANQAAQAFLPRRLEPERHTALCRKLSALWHHGPCILYRCDSCDFIYADPFVSGDAEFYDLAFPDASYPRRKWEYDRTRQALRECKFAEPSLLEIGAGNGAFLKQLLEDGWSPADLQAFEFSSSGRADIERIRVNCLAADLRSVELNRVFDVVCMFQVLEHLDDYDGIFEVLKRIVRPGAHFFVAIPNGGWISLNESRRLMLDMPPNHLSRWSQVSLAALACRFGWRLAECELEPPSRVQTVTRTLTDRFIRLVNDESFWESRAAELAVGTRSRGLARFIKAGAALTSPACLCAAIRAALAPVTSQNIWAHLIRPGEA